MNRCLVACAGWSLPRDLQHEFPGAGSHLERYARRFPATEINSSFHRRHREFAWRRWAQSVPDAFRFCAKLPKAITHVKRLAGVHEDLREFIADTAPLGGKLACVLVQLPPSLRFDAPGADGFLRTLREAWKGDAALEPRHESWFTREADSLLRDHRVARVLADPVRFAAAAAPGGYAGLVYLRLHGSPRMYYSAYPREILTALARRIAVELAEGRTVWCVFDNTASGAAAHDALALQAALARETVSPRTSRRN